MIYHVKRCLAGLPAFFFFCTACNHSTPGSATGEVQVKSATVSASAPEATLRPDSVASVAESTLPMARISAPDYTVEIFRAIAFYPKLEIAGPLQLKKGHRYVVLDIAVKNESAKKEVEFGQILRSATVRDEKGREYGMSAMAVAAYRLENPDPEHQAKYNALSDRLKPGEYYRTVAFGFQAPETAKAFDLRMKEDGDLQTAIRWKTAKFSVE